MAAAKAIIVRGGYNTLIEAVQLGKPIVSVPRPPKGADREQTARAEALAKAGHIQHVSQAACEAMLAENDTTPFAKALDQSLMGQTQQPIPLNFQGAANATYCLIELRMRPARSL